MRYLVLLLTGYTVACQQQAEQLTSPYVVQQGEAVYWTLLPTMDSNKINSLSQTLLEYNIFFKPVIDRDDKKQITEVWGNMIVFDKSRTKRTDTLLSNRLILPNERANWLASQSISVGHTKATLRIPPLGFWYDPKSGLHSDVIGENFPKSLRDRVEKEFPATASAVLANENAKRIKNFKSVLAKGKPAFAFTLPDSTGKQISLSDYKGKVIYLDFWAHWCKPCIGEMEEIKHIEKQVKSHPDLVLLYISVDEQNDKDKWMTALKKHRFLGTHLLAKGGYKGPTARMYGINSVPTKFIIDRKGNFYETNLPYPTEGKTLINLLEKALAEK